MAKLIQPSSQVAPPVQQPVMANAGAFQADTRGLQAVGQLGGQLASIGQNQLDIRKRLAEKRQEYTNKLQGTRVSSALDITGIEINAVYETIQDPTEWEGHINNILEGIDSKVNPYLEKMDSEARQMAEQAIQSYKDTELAKWESASTVAIVDNAWIDMSERYKSFLSQNNTEMASIVLAEMDESWNDKFGVRAEFESYVNKLTDDGVAEYKENRDAANKALLAGAIKSGTQFDGDVSADKIESFIRERMKGLDEAEIEELVDYGKTVGERTSIDEKKILDERKGAIASEFIDLGDNLTVEYIDEKMTSAELATVPLSQRADYMAFFEKYRSKVEQRDSIEANLTNAQKQVRYQKNYSPGLASKLTDEAERVQTREEADALLEKVLDAENNYNIEKSESRAIQDIIRGNARSLPQKILDDHLSVDANALIGPVSVEQMRIAQKQASGAILSQNERMLLRSQSEILQANIHQYRLLKIELNNSLREFQKSYGRDPTREEIDVMHTKSWVKYTRKSDIEKIRELNKYSGSAVPVLSGDSQQDIPPDGAEIVEYSSVSERKKIKPGTWIKNTITGKIEKAK